MFPTYVYISHRAQQILVYRGAEHFIGVEVSESCPDAEHFLYRAVVKFSRGQISLNFHIDGGIPL